MPDEMTREELQAQDDERWAAFSALMEAEAEDPRQQYWFGRVVDEEEVPIESR